ncbi:MAG: NAD(+)--rifampin ADP-ribosyltransferase [Eubacteriaceae bacterium]|nr:NAD(+)--rifampin ADP-ribosyltransferase [Eubacteriaceae bacterium]
MDTQFDPNNNIIKLCLRGMGMEDSGKPEDASLLFLKAWSEATDDFERFIAAYYVARHQKNISDKLKWLETSLQFALKLNDDTVKSAFPLLYLNIAKCYEELGDPDKAKKNYELSNSYKIAPSDKGPFYHGTKADLQVGDLLTAKGDSNYKPDLKMNHIYFTALINGARLAAALAKGEGSERVYIVEPTGKFENDPNVTDKKFPGNLTRSYRSQEPLKIVGEETEWVRQTPVELRLWREKLANNKGEIIN